MSKFTLSLHFLFVIFCLLKVSNGQKNIFLKLRNGPDSVIDRINRQTFKNREEKLIALRAELVNHASTTQLPILNFIKTFLNIEYQSFWISNEVYMKGIGGGLLSNLQSLFGNIIGSISDETFATFNTDFVKSPSMKQSETNFTWGQLKIQTREAWALNGGKRGSGVIVGSIDSGVRRTHEALFKNYIGQNGWFDPDKKTDLPNDQNGHGTHTMGTIVGSNGIGVAPGAKWVACKGCAGSGCATSHLKACFQFMICPTNTQGNNPDCKKTPVVVNNSWGTTIRTSAYDEEIKVMRTANIFPVFSNGNSGPRCFSTSSPADNRDVVGVGSTTDEDKLSYFSSKGPVGLRIKPDISGPGSDVYSAWFDGDRSYNTISGTSMSGPHVAGVVALMFAAKPNMKYDEVKNHLLNGCTTEGLGRPLLRCGASGFLRYRFPNSDYGYGLLNARNSVDLTIKSV